MSSLEEPVAATHHFHSKALAATGCVPVPAPLRGSIAASNAPIAHAVGRSPNVVGASRSLTAPCPTFTVVAGDPLTRWASFVSPSALTRLRRAARDASTKRALIAQILDFMPMNDSSGARSYDSQAFEAERQNLASMGTADLLKRLKEISQSDTAPRQVLRLTRAMVFASERAQLDALLAEIGREAVADRARVLDAVRRVQGITGRCPNDFEPSDYYAILCECRRPASRGPRSGVKGAHTAARPKQYWSLTAPLERYVRRRVVEYALDALEVVMHFDPTLVERVTRDRIAFAALLDVAYALATDAGARATDMLQPLDLAASRLGLVGGERAAACRPRPARVRDHSEEGAERRKDARRDRFPIEKRTSQMISRGMSSVDDESPASPTQKLLIDRLRDSPRPRFGGRR